MSGRGGKAGPGPRVGRRVRVNVIAGIMRGVDNPEINDRKRPISPMVSASSVIPVSLLDMRDVHNRRHTFRTECAILTKRLKDTSVANDI